MTIPNSHGLFFSVKSLMLLKATQQLFKKIQIEQICPIMRINSDQGREFENARFEEFCPSHGIQLEFSSPITPQKNGVVERK
jgi:transposase InsO family protein